MPHPIYGPPSHVLHRVEFTLALPVRTNGYRSRVTAHGYSETKRGTLWSMSEQWEVSGRDHGLEPVDLLHHLALVSIQDHPTSQRELERGLRGGLDLEDPHPLF